MPCPYVLLIRLLPTAFCLLPPAYPRPHASKKRRASSTTGSVTGT